MYPCPTDMPTTGEIESQGCPGICIGGNYLILGDNANKTITFSHAMHVLLPNYVPGKEGNSTFPFGLGMKLILPRERRDRMASSGNKRAGGHNDGLNAEVKKPIPRPV